MLWAEQLSCLPLPELARLYRPKCAYYIIKKQWMSSVCPQNRCSASSVSPRKKTFCEKMYSMIHLLLQVLLIALSVTLSEEKSKETQRRLPYWRLFWSLICWAPWNSCHWHLLILDQALAELNKWFSSTVQQRLLIGTRGGAQIVIRLIRFAIVDKSSSHLCFSMACRGERKKWKCLLGKSLEDIRLSQVATHGWIWIEEKLLYLIRRHGVL